MSASNDRWGQYKADIEARLDCAGIYAGIKNAKPSGKGHMLGLCPFHDDHDPSFSFNTTTGGWTCFAGCGNGSAFDFLMRQSGRTFIDVLTELGDRLGLERPTSSTRDAGEVVYPYQDERGTLLYEVVRKPGKKWAQRRPDGKGGSVWNLKGVRRVLYHLPELIARPEEVVYIPEGEKDADRLAGLGLLSTTNSGGAGKWRPAYSEVLTGRDVVILPDNDQPGIDHAAKVAKSLRTKARSVRVVLLPGLGLKQDVSDWLSAGGDRQQLEALVSQTPKYEPGSLDPPSVDEANADLVGLPVIELFNRPLRDIFDDSWAAVLAANDPPQVFNMGGYLARLRDLGFGPQIELLKDQAAISLLARVADWIDSRKVMPIHTKPPKEAAADLIVNPHPSLPRLDSVIHTPVFDHDWRLITEPGYHRESSLWLHQAPGIPPLAVPLRPTDTEVRAALSLILDDLLVDFPFTAKSDRVHAIAALLLPFVRRMFRGPTPIHLIEASTPGSGKSLLVEIIAIIALGRFLGCTTLTTDENETRKKLTALLSRGPAVVAVDNLQGGLWSAQVAAAITAEVWEDRILGQSKMVTFPNRALWLMSGNNPRLSGEIARRCIRIRIDTGQEQPWKRTGFKHDPIREWVKQNRPQLVQAILTLIQHWIMSGAPMLTYSQPKGSFETWSRIVGGIIQHHGLPEFLGDTDAFYEAADPEAGEWRAFVHAWWEAHRDTPVSAKDLLQLAMNNDLVAFAFSANSESAQRIRFGRALSGLRDRRFGDLRVVVATDAHNKVKVFRLVPVEKGPSA